MTMTRWGLACATLVTLAPRVGAAQTEARAPAPAATATTTVLAPPPPLDARWATLGAAEIRAARAQSGVNHPAAPRPINSVGRWLAISSGALLLADAAAGVVFLYRCSEGCDSRAYNDVPVALGVALAVGMAGGVAGLICWHREGSAVNAGGERFAVAPWVSDRSGGVVVAAGF